MPLTQLDTGGIARCLAQIADRPDDHVDAYFEIQTENRLTGRAMALTPQRRREQGLAVRLLRDGRSWLASTDEVTPDAFARALASVARARPGAVAPAPRGLACAEPEAEDEREMARFVEAVEEAIKGHHAAFPVSWDLSLHRRFSRVLGSMFSPVQQTERFFSCVAVTPWARWGGLLLDLGPTSVRTVAESLTSIFRARRAPPADIGRTDVVLGPNAAAILLHEAVAHALETDTLALSGNPAAAIGVEMAAPLLDVIDDPAGAPAAVARSVDDEGSPVVRRWLLRGGVVEQPLTDLLRGAGSSQLIPGAGRRGSRHLAPVPRSTQLELLAGSSNREQMVGECEAGLYVEEFARGSLDPLSGRLRLEFQYARRIEAGGLGAAVGHGCLTGSAADLLRGVRALGSEARPAGAGWCAKSGHRLAVWAKAPAMLLGGVEVGR